MIAITGGAGFLGSHIYTMAVKSGRKATILDVLNRDKFDEIKKIRFNGFSNSIKYTQIDITDTTAVNEYFKKNDVEEIVHTAALTYIPFAVENPRKAFEVNLTGTFNLLEASRHKGIKRFVYVSTSSTYGDFQKIPADETHPLCPKDIYGATKAAADLMVQSYGKTYLLPISIVRTSSIYGPGELEKRVVKNFVENALSGKPLELQGGGELRRDFSYVEDVANGIIRILESEEAIGEMFNITGGTDHSIRELAETVKKYIPKTEFIFTEGRKIDLKRGQLDLSKAERLVGYKPEFDLDRGVREYTRWICDVYAPVYNLEVIRKPLID